LLPFGPSAADGLVTEFNCRSTFPLTGKSLANPDVGRCGNERLVLRKLLTFWLLSN